MARTSSKIVKNIPSSETGKVKCINLNKDEYIISQNSLKMQFTLWKCIEDGFEKISTSNNPSDFDEIVFEK